jgi:hypothetical protein
MVELPPEPGYQDADDPRLKQSIHRIVNKAYGIEEEEIAQPTHKSVARLVDEENEWTGSVDWLEILFRILWLLFQIVCMFSGGGAGSRFGGGGGSFGGGGASGKW